MCARIIVYNCHAHNTAQNSSDNFPTQAYPPDNRRSSDDVRRGGGTTRASCRRHHHPRPSWATRFALGFLHPSVPDQNL